MTPFFHTTAELAVQVAEAVFTSPGRDAAFVADFCDATPQHVANALGLAADLGLIASTGGVYESASLLTRFLSHPDHARKAAVLRLVLESYKPFRFFCERLDATDQVDTAAEQTRVALRLNAHRTEIRDTLVSLGTYSRAIRVEGGGRYLRDIDLIGVQLLDTAKTCEEFLASEARIRVELGPHADHVDYGEVLQPLANALLRANQGQPDSAVFEAARAIESFLARLAPRLAVSLVGANGLGQLLDKFAAGNALPKKLRESAKYLVQVRNAADHGVDIDPDVGASWAIRSQTGTLFVMAACGLVVACCEFERNRRFLL